MVDRIIYILYRLAMGPELASVEMGHRRRIARFWDIRGKLSRNPDALRVRRRIAYAIENRHGPRRPSCDMGDKHERKAEPEHRDYRRYCVGVGRSMGVY